MQANESTRINPICINAVQSQPRFGVGNDGLSRCPKHFLAQDVLLFFKGARSCDAAAKSDGQGPCPRKRCQATLLTTNKTRAVDTTTLRLSSTFKNGFARAFGGSVDFCSQACRPSHVIFLEPVGLRNRKTPEKRRTRSFRSDNRPPPATNARRPSL